MRPFNSGNTFMNIPSKHIDQGFVNCLYFNLITMNEADETFDKQ